MHEPISAKSFLKKMFSFSVPTFIGALISFGSTMLVTRLFSTEELGKINLFITFLTLFSAIAYFGFDQAQVRFYYEPPYDFDKKKLSGFCLSVSLAVFCLIALFVISNSEYFSISITGEFSVSVIICLLLSVFGSVVTRYTQLISRMEQNSFLYGIQNISLVFVTKIAYVFSAFFAFGYKTAPIIIAAGYILISIIFYLKHRNDFEFQFKVNKKVRKTLFKYALPLMPISLLTTLNNSISQLMLNKYVSFSAIGIYSSAITITNILSLVQTGFNVYWSSFVYENYKNEHSKIMKIHELITFVMTEMGLSIVLFQDLVYLLLGENFRASRVFFPFLLIGPIAYTVSETTGLGIGISKKSYISLIISIVTILLNIFLCYKLLPIVGVLGAAISSAIAAVVRLALGTFIGEKFYKTVGNYLKILISFVLLFLASINNVLFYDHVVLRQGCVVVFIIVEMIVFKNQFLYLIEVAKGSKERNK